MLNHANMVSLKKHLDKIRSKSHETQRKNGHYKKMSDLGREASKLAIKEYWKNKKRELPA